MEITTQIKKRFCKDFNLPINVLQEPYFEYFVDLYDNHYKVREKLEWLKEVLKDCDNQEQFFGMSESIASRIKETIKSTKAYENFNNANLKEEFVKKEQITRQNIYIVPNINKELISIDLDKANFNCFRIFGLQKELGVEKYDDLIKKFTPYDYFINSKMIRQIIFGDLNPSRQQKIQQYIIDSFCTKLLQNGCKLSSASSDEIIISNNIGVDKVKEILKGTPYEFNFFRVERFSFNKISEKEDLLAPDHKTDDFFIKKTIKSNGEEKLEFKSVPGHLHAQVFKKYYGLEAHENDLLFFHETFLAQFKEPLYKPQLKTINKLKF